MNMCTLTGCFVEMQPEFRRLGFITELCVLRTFGGVDFSLVFICAQSVPEFLWDRLRASIQFPVMSKRAQYTRFSGEDGIPESVLCRSMNSAE
eukprot:COSAG02_NODE_816_length_16859_cov_15.645764_5_plen_93_part_00